jgi:site-specific DNA recombinase
VIRAASYARYSSDLQSDRSIDDQLFDCRKRAKQDGLTIVYEYEDRARSGSSIHGRDGISEMLEAAQKGKFQFLVVESLDRISRSQADLATIFEKLKFWGIGIRTVHDGAADQIAVGIRGIVSALYLTDLSQKVRRGQSGNIRQGKSAGGSAYGYRSIPGKPGEWVIDEQEAEIVRRIYRQYLSGQRPRKIVEQLNAEGIRAPRGKYWQAGALTGSNNRHNGILGNEIYAGQLVWNKVRMVRNPDSGKRISRPNPDCEWERTPAKHLQIISPEEFEETARIRRERRSVAPALRRSPKRILSGLLRCATCGGGMSIKGKDRGGVRIVCTQFHNARRCANNRTYNLHHVEEIVLSGLRRHLVDPSAIRLFLKTYQVERKRLAAFANSLGPPLEKRLGEVNRKISRLTDAMIDSDEPVSQFTAKIRELEIERRSIETELANLSAPTKAVALHPAAQERYLAIVDNLSAAMAEGGPLDEITGAVRELIESVVVEKTGPGEPIQLQVNGRLAALVGRPVFPESSLSGVKMVAREGLEPPTPGL